MSFERACVSLAPSLLTKFDGWATERDIARSRLLGRVIRRLDADPELRRRVLGPTLSDNGPGVIAEAVR